jgi:hypothetical protein
MDECENSSDNHTIMMAAADILRKKSYLHELNCLPTHYLMGMTSKPIMAID